MTTKTADKPLYDLGNFDGTDVGAPIEEKWDYTGIGYNASSGVFYVDSNEQESLSIIPLAIRECKEIETPDGMTHRYPTRWPRAKMAEGDYTARMQVICYVNGELYNFGMRSYTARASFMNPAGGSYRNDAFSLGIWRGLVEHIKEVKAQTGKQTTPLCWKLALGAGDNITVGTGKNTSKSHPIVLKGIEFVGAELANELTQLYLDEDIAGWVAEWKKTAVEEAAEEIDDVETFIPEDDEIPF